MSGDRLPDDVTARREAVNRMTPEKLEQYHADIFAGRVASPSGREYGMGLIEAPDELFADPSVEETRPSFASDAQGFLVQCPWCADGRSACGVPATTFVACERCSGHGLL